MNPSRPEPFMGHRIGYGEDWMAVVKLVSGNYVICFQDGVCLSVEYGQEFQRWLNRALTWIASRHSDW